MSSPEISRWQVQPQNRAAAIAIVADLKRETAAIQEEPYQPKCFDLHQYQTLGILCQAIIPADEECGGAVEAEVPQWIDTLASQGLADKTRLRGGLTWIDVTSTCAFGHCFSACSPAEQEHLLNLLADTKDNPSTYGQIHDAVAGLSYGKRFFLYLRSLAADGFFTSRIGIAYLGYLGNQWQTEFPGCPPFPDEKTAGSAAATMEREEP